MIVRYKFYFFLGLIGCLFWGCQAESNQKPENHSRILKIQEDVSVDSIEANIKKLAAFHTRHTTSDTTSDSTGIGAARRWIFHKFQQYRKQSNNRLKVKYDRYVETENDHIDEPTEIVNIIAALPGTQLESKDRIYIVSSHYDSRVSDVMNDTSFAPGANDNASGMAAVMELARVMSKHEFDATLKFMAVAGEKQGLLGAEHFAEKLKSHNRNVAAMITNDNIGNTIKSSDGSIHDDEVWVFAEGIPAGEKLSDYHRMLLSTGGENDTPSRQLGRFIRRVCENTIPDLNVNLIYRKDRYLKGGDHTAFLDKGYPAVRFTEPHEYYERQHQDFRKEKGVQYGDLPEFVDYEYVGKVTRLNAGVLATLANAPEAPRGVKVEVKKLENNTTLNWKANKEPDLKGYEIVWRKTHKPFWNQSKFVGDSTRHTIQGVSKDSYLFGVRSVDKFGNKSRAVYPSPAGW